MTNLYFPDAWMEQVQRKTEHLLSTRQFGLRHASYLRGIAELDRNGTFGWLAAVTFINLWNVSQDVPSWYYSHQRDPDRHDYRVFDGTEGDNASWDYAESHTAGDDPFKEGGHDPYLATFDEEQGII